MGFGLGPLYERAENSPRCTWPSLRILRLPLLKKIKKIPYRHLFYIHPPLEPKSTVFFRIPVVPPGAVLGLGILAISNADQIVAPRGALFGNFQKKRPLNCSAKMLSHFGAEYNILPTRTAKL